MASNEDFEKALKFVIEQEGGYIIHKNKGEKDITFAGIYRYAYPNWEGWKYIDEGNIERAKELVKDFYYYHFWKPLKAEYLPSKIAIMLFDTAVNLGIRRTIKGIQRLVGTKPDGIIGKKTIEKILQHNENELVIEYCRRRIVFYSRLNCEKYNIFKNGWIKRVFKLMEFLEVLKCGNQ